MTREQMKNLTEKEIRMHSSPVLAGLDMNDPDFDIQYKHWIETGELGTPEINDQVFDLMEGGEKLDLFNQKEDRYAKWYDESNLGEDYRPADEEIWATRGKLLNEEGEWQSNLDFRKDSIVKFMNTGTFQNFPEEDQLKLVSELNRLTQVGGEEQDSLSLENVLGMVGPESNLKGTMGYQEDLSPGAGLGEDMIEYISSIFAKNE